MASTDYSIAKREQLQAPATTATIVSEPNNGCTVRPVAQLAQLARAFLSGGAAAITYQDFPKKATDGKSKDEYFTLLSIATDPPQVSTSSLKCILKCWSMNTRTHVTQP